MPLMRGGQPPTRSDERLGFLFAVASDPMLILENGERLSASTIVDCNQKALELFGYRRDALLGRHFSLLQLEDADLPELEPGIVSTDEAAQRRSDGQVIVVQRTFQPVESDDRKLVLVAFHDITTARLLERAILRVQQMDNVGIVSGALVHDFRNYLAGIVASAELALADPSDHEGALQRMSEVLRNARAATEIVGRLLPTAGPASQPLQRVEVDAIVRDAVGLMQASLLPNIDVHLDLGAGGLLVMGDAAQLRQVVMNLVINAAEAISSHSGEIRIVTGPIGVSHIDFRNARLPVDNPFSQWVYLDVIDSGSGIDPATSDRIFEPLFTTRSSGTGLGLTAVLFAVRRHGGTITLRSKLGEGSTFRVLLPVRES